ncbi:hypothetical protein [Flagellimonas sp.]|uniref:hypothetical protein n=1 Tax=Flagellimonas sp. TaxID=2058762 RepID=UPI003BAD5E40
MEKLLKQALNEFFLEISNEKWPGKERELVSRFAFSTLVNKTGLIPEFFDSGQIGLEVRVKQVPGENKKEFVCKDLVIWKEPNSNAWTTSKVPVAILEWKHNNGKPSKYDIDWLKEFTPINPDCIGIALNIDTKDKYKLTSTLIKNGMIHQENWIEFIADQ